MDQNAQALAQFRNLSYDDRKRVMDAMPGWMVARVLSQGTKDQVRKTFQEYHDHMDERIAAQEGNAVKVMKRYQKKIKALVQQLRKARKSHWIPGYIKENYL